MQMIQMPSQLCIVLQTLHDFPKAHANMGAMALCSTVKDEKLPSSVLVHRFVGRQAHEK